MTKKFSVILPTTGEKESVIRYAIQSVLDQALVEFELFVIGDGGGNSTRELVEILAENDSRVRYFDFTKHARRGEEYRHDLIVNHCSGANIAYICDRDLWCRDHLSLLYEKLQTCDFAHTLCLIAGEQGIVGCQPLLNLNEWAVDSAQRKLWLKSNPYPKVYEHGQQVLGIPLSLVGHTRLCYINSGICWSTTPFGWPTDHYMWRKFMANRDVTTGTVSEPTVIYFPTVFWNENNAARALALEHWIGEVSSESWDRQKREYFADMLYQACWRSSKHLTNLISSMYPETLAIPDEWGTEDDPKLNRLGIS